MGCEICQTCIEAFVSGDAGGCPAAGFFAGGMLASVIAFGIVLAFFLIVVFYVYTSMAWMTIARKLKYKHSWLAWIPIARTSMILQLGNFGWAWIFLIFVPVLGWLALFVMGVIATWKIFVKRKYPGWFSLAIFIPKIGGILYLVVIGVAAWSKK